MLNQFEFNMPFNPSTVEIDVLVDYLEKLNKAYRKSDPIAPDEKGRKSDHRS